MKIAFLIIFSLISLSSSLPTKQVSDVFNELRELVGKDNLKAV
jgi:hypothetical protein